MTPKSSVFLLIAYFIPFSFAQYCRLYGCASGYTCDTNTGYCRKFRQAYPGNVGCGVCPLGTKCDYNTGKCQPFRSSNIGNGASPRCARVYCPTGYYCDSNTGYCTTERQPYNPYSSTRSPYDPYSVTTPSSIYNPYASSTQVYDPYSSSWGQLYDIYSSSNSNRCYGVVCPTGQQCDQNTGLCRPFRSYRKKRQADLCVGVTCPSGTSCDSNTGKCQSFRRNNEILTIQAEDKCATLTCPSGMICDSTTGTCRTIPISTLPLQRDDQCLRVFCPDGYYCETSTGICQPNSKIVQRDDPCSRITCPQGTQCDSNTGMCRQFRPAADQPAIGNNYCERVSCPAGYFCDPSTGFCQSFTQRDDPCSRITCPQGTSCDSNTGLCQQFRPATNYLANPVNICANMYCPTGTICNAQTGSCQGYVRDPTIPNCPANSHWVPCASPCPYSCTHRGDRCQLPCISTCVCNEGYVEASRTDLTCIPQQQCEAYNTNRCISPKCGPNEECVDDLCNSSLCPQIARPSLRIGCKYVLTRNVNNCLMFDLQCQPNL